MSAPTTSVLYGASTPAPDAGQQNAKPRSDGGAPLQQITFEVPNTGGVLTKTANYTAAAGDCGRLLSFNSGSAVVYTLPATPPVVGATQWQVEVQNSGAGALSITPTSTALLDGSSGSLVLAQGSGLSLYTDGTNYFTGRGAPASAAPSGAAGGDLVGTYPNPGVAKLNGTLLSGLSTGLLKNTTATGVPTIAIGSDIPNIAESQVTNLTTDLAAKASIAAVQQESYTYAADTGTANAYAVALSPAPTIVAGSVVRFKVANLNTGASTLAVNGGSATPVKKLGATAFSGGEWPAGMIVEVVSDGTNWQWTSVPPVAISLFFGQGDGIAGTGQNEVTLGSTPLTGSVALFVAGAILPPSSYTVTGAVAALNSGTFGNGNAVTVYWATSNSTPGGISLGTAAVLNPAVRGTAIQASSNSTYTVPFTGLTPPGGGSVSAQVGDLAVICCGHGWNATTPSGWTANDNTSGPNWNGAVFSKTLSSGDISTSHVSISFAGSFDGVLAIVVFVGATVGIRETDVHQSGFGASTSTVTTSGAVLNTDTNIYFGSNRAVSTNTINVGTPIASSPINDGSAASGCLNTEMIGTSGAVSAIVSYSSAGSGLYQAVVVVKGV